MAAFLTRSLVVEHDIVDLLYRFNKSELKKKRAADRSASSKRRWRTIHMTTIESLAIAIDAKG